jgi:hypothetical protein
MKKIMTLIFFPLLPFLSNAQLHFVSEYDATGQKTGENTLTDLPLVSHNRKVDVYFNQERPKVPFYKIRVISLAGSVTSSYNHLLSQLQDKAMKEGFDGLLMLDIKQVTDPYYNYFLHHDDFVNFQNLHAIGIKYKTNMDYVDTIIKSATIELSHPLKTYQVNFNMNGLFSDTLYTEGHSYYLQNISLFNKADLFLRHQRISSPEEGFSATDEAKMNTDSGIIRYTASYQGSELGPVNIKLPGSNPRSERIYAVSYGRQQGKPVTRWVFKGRKKQPYFKDVYSYDEKNRCSGFIRYDLKTNAELLKVKYDFFTRDDLPLAED